MMITPPHTMSFAAHIRSRGAVFTAAVWVLALGCEREPERPAPTTDRSAPRSSTGETSIEEKPAPIGFAEQELGPAVSSEQRAILLERHCPILMVSGPEGSPGREYPLDIEWWVSQCELRTRTGDPKPAASIAEVLRRQAEVNEPTQLTLTLPDGAEREAKMKGHRDRGDHSPARLPSAYGVVTRGENSVVRIMYLFFFGQSIHEPRTSDMNTEGDWIAVDFDVDYSVPEAPVFTAAVCHNHGRQIYVDEPQTNLAFVGQQPRIWLEDTTHEPWPISGAGWNDGGDGFAPAHRMPRWLWTNHALTSADAERWGFTGLGNVSSEWIEKFTGRGHSGKEELHVARIIDVTEASGSDAARLLHDFLGAFGRPLKSLGAPPRSPTQSPAVWERRFSAIPDVRGQR